MRIESAKTKAAARGLGPRLSANIGCGAPHWTGSKSRAVAMLEPSPALNRSPSVQCANSCPHGSLPVIENLAAQDMPFDAPCRGKPVSSHDRVRLTDRAHGAAIARPARSRLSRHDHQQSLLPPPARLYRLLSGSDRRRGGAVHRSRQSRMGASSLLWRKRKTQEATYSFQFYASAPVLRKVLSMLGDIRFQSAGTENARTHTMDKPQGGGFTRTIRRQQLKEIVPLADSTIFGMEQRGEFPRRFALSPRCVVWDLSEIEEWLASRRTNPIARGQQVDVHCRRTRPVRGSDQVRA